MEILIFPCLLPHMKYRGKVESKVFHSIVKLPILAV